MENIPINTFKFKDIYNGFPLAYDLFNNETIQLMWTSGHSKDMISVLVKNEEKKFVLIINDTGYIKDSWKSSKTPEITVNKKQALNSLKWVQKMSNDINCLEILANHEKKFHRKLSNYDLYKN